MDISIPSLNKENKVFPFFVESLRFKNGRGECLVTGLVDNSIIESVQVAISVIKKFYNIINISKKRFLDLIFMFILLTVPFIRKERLQD